MGIYLSESKFRKKYLRLPSIVFDFCNSLHVNFFQLPDEKISISSLGRSKTVCLHAHVAVELSVLAIIQSKVILTQAYVTV